MKIPKIPLTKLPFLPRGNGPVAAHTRGVFYALAITLAAILTLAFFVKFTGLPNAVTRPIVQIVKALSILAGVFTVLKIAPKRAWLHGAVMGLIYTVLAFFLLSIIDADFTITGGIFIELLFALSTGIACALLLRLFSARA